MYEFYKENRTVCIVTIIVILLCIAGAWLYHDSHRNEPIYNNTDNTVEQLKDRIDSIEQRIGTMQERLDKATETVSGVTETVRHSRENAVTVADGISGTEERLNDAIQRSGRIQNIIADIETANQQGKKNP